MINYEHILKFFRQDIKNSTEKLSTEYYYSKRYNDRCIEINLFFDTSTVSLLRYYILDDTFSISYYKNHFIFKLNQNEKQTVYYDFCDNIKFSTEEELFQLQTLCSDEELFAIKMHNIIKEFIAVSEE